MANFDLTVGGSTYSLPAPMQNGYTVEDMTRGTAHRMASGVLAWEVTSTAIWRRFTLEWSNITDADHDIVDNAVTALLAPASGTFVCPSHGSKTVLLAENGAPSWQVRNAKKNTELRFSGRLVLEQSA